MSRKISWLMSTVALGALSATPAVQAFNYNFGDVNFSLDTQLKEAVAVRVQSRDPLYIALDKGGKAYSSNADNGDLNFAPGSIIQAASIITSALKVSYEGFGIFTRANYVFDPSLQDRNYFSASDFGAGHQYSQAVRAAANSGIRDHIASDGTILDLYAYANFDIAGHSANLRIGRQVVNWGETTIVLNGLNSINAVDANKARIPGATFESIFIPAAMAFASVNLTENTSIEGFYQLKWQCTIPDVTGSYFSTNDYIGYGGVAGNLDFGRAIAGEYADPGSPCFDPNTGITSSCVPYGGSTPRGPDRPAKNSGQFGGAMRFLIPELNDLALSLYGANYHSRLPLYSSISAKAPPSPILSTDTSVFAEYPEDIHMYGMSFNTSLPFGFSLQGEYNYRPNQPIEIDDVEQSFADLGAPSQLNETAGGTLGQQYLRGWRRKKISFFDLGTTKVLAPSKWFHYDDLTFLAEAALIHVHDLENNATLLYEGPGTFLPGNAQGALIAGLVRADGTPIVQQGGFATKTSWGYKMAIVATYNNVFSHLNLKPALRFDHDVGGVTPQPLGNFVRGSRLLTPDLGFQYGAGFTADIGYNYYFGGGQGNLLRDRDFAWLTVRYDF
jgi:hypothetical protein